MIIRARIEKGEQVRYISHLDFSRAMERALRRARIPIAFSQGFNPHPKMAFASALAVGVTSQGEYMDFELTRDMNPEEFKQRLNDVLPPGIQILSARVLPEGQPALMAVIAAAEYKAKVRFAPGGPPVDADQVSAFFALGKILYHKVQKGTEKETDLKPGIYRYTILQAGNDELHLDLLLSSGSRLNIRPEDVLMALAGWLHRKIAWTDIHRTALYQADEGEWKEP